MFFSKNLGSSRPLCERHVGHWPDSFPRIWQCKWKQFFSENLPSAWGRLSTHSLCRAFPSRPLPLLLFSKLSLICLIISRYLGHLLFDTSTMRWGLPPSVHPVREDLSGFLAKGCLIFSNFPRLLASAFPSHQLLASFLLLLLALEQPAAWPGPAHLFQDRSEPFPRQMDLWRKKPFPAQLQGCWQTSGGKSGNLLRHHYPPSLASLIPFPFPRVGVVGCHPCPGSLRLPSPFLRIAPLDCFSKHSDNSSRLRPCLSFLKSAAVSFAARGVQGRGVTWRSLPGWAARNQESMAKERNPNEQLYWTCIKYWCKTCWPCGMRLTTCVCKESKLVGKLDIGNLLAVAKFPKVQLPLPLV